MTTTPLTRKEHASLTCFALAGACAPALLLGLACQNVFGWSWAAALVASFVAAFVLGALQGRLAATLGRRWLRCIRGYDHAVLSLLGAHDRGLVSREALEYLDTKDVFDLTVLASGTGHRLRATLSAKLSDCPACNTQRDADQVRCPVCDYEFRTGGVVSPCS